MKQLDKKRTKKLSNKRKAVALAMMGGMMIQMVPLPAHASIIPSSWVKSCKSTTSTFSCNSYVPQSNPCKIVITPRTHCGTGAWYCPSAAGSKVMVKSRSGVCSNSLLVGSKPSCVRWHTTSYPGTAKC